MPANVKVELINPDTDEIVESVEGQGILPEVHKYLSTFGFPYIVKVKPDNSPASNLFWNSAYIFQGIMCNSEAIDSSKSKCTFKPCIDVTARGNYCTEAFTVTASSVNYTMGDLDSKYGYYNANLSYNTLEKCVKVWEWDQDHGNGDIASVGLTTSPAAITYNKGFPEEILALPAAVVYPLSGMTKQNNFSSSIPHTDSTSNFSGNDGSYVQAMINVDLPSSDEVIGCYETSKNIVFLKILKADYTYNDVTYPAKLNELQEDGTYVTRVYYKAVDKKWLYKYRQPIMGTEETGSTSSVYHPLATIMSAYIVANSDGYIDINTGDSTFNTTYSTFFYNVEDNAYAVIGHQYGSSNDNPATDYDSSIYTSTFFKNKFYVISGDTPTLEVFDTVHCTPLLTMSGTTYAQNVNYVLFTKDKSVILRYYRSSKYHFIEKRTLYNFSLVWRTALDITAPTNTSWATIAASVIDQIYGGDKYYAVMYLYVGKNSSTARVMPRASIVFDLDTGNILGYTSGIAPTSTLASTYKLIYYDKENPFRIYYTQNTSAYDIYLAMYTNFFTMKCNLPNTITKTSDYKMRVTVEIIPE